MNRAMTRHIALVLGSAIAGCALAASPGQAIYETHCSVCHGHDGKGTLPGVPDFTRKNGVLSLSPLGVDPLRYLSCLIAAPTPTPVGRKRK